MQIVGPSLSSKTPLAVPPSSQRPRLFSTPRRQPLLLPKSRVLLRFELATHLQPLSNPGSALSPRSARRRDEPLSSTPAAGHVDPGRPDARNRQITPNHSLSQNLYPGGREQASQNRNYHYTVLFKNPADTRYVKALGNRRLIDSPAF